MSHHENGGAGLLVCLALAFVIARGAHASSLRGLKYHALRAWGIHIAPPPDVVDSAIDKAADDHGVPRNLFRAVVHVESRKNPTAVSLKGALGVAQVMPANAGHCGLNSAHQLRDVINNTQCGAQILAENLRLFGDQRLALMGYNWGSANVRKWLKAGRPKGMVPAETLAYVPSVLSRANQG